MPRCSSAGSGRCCCSRCIRWRWPASRSIPTIAATRGVDYSGPVRSWRSTTFGPAADAQRAVDRIRGIHQRVRGIAPDGRPYHAADPHLLEWVHVAEVDSFCSPTSSTGRPRSTRAVAMGTWPIPPESPWLSACLTRREARASSPSASRLSGRSWASTAAAREAARFLLLTPPLPIAARGPYAVLAATSVAMLPPWARMPLLLPYFPPVEATVIRMAGRALVGGIRWAMTPDAGGR